ncbi:hypothetical protein INT45_011829 [Circinella minor]|uniref:Uncharacterized protein n=1 Tax=Circinella minor TaxID=1195481 RepID=A0A8H7S9K2_9FUNG|nr:hypothetical protein INT45_011829 [Circinella minor]
MTPSKLEEQRDKFHQEERIKRQELLKQLQDDCNKLRGSVQRKIDVFHRLPLSVGSNDAIKTTKDSTRLEQIKDCFHPYLRLSRQGIIDQLGQILIRVNTLAISNPSEIQLRETLESFATKWQQELDQDNIYIEESGPREDAVDSITKLANALKKHNVKRQSEFVIKQEKLLRSKLNILQQSNKEVLSIMDAIEERQYIEEGTIGLDYTYQDRTLQEWISLLSKNNNNNNN